jgi:hypothetical protein
VSSGRDDVTREELVEAIKERFRKIEEINGGNDPTEGGGAVGPSHEPGGVFRVLKRGSDSRGSGAVSGAGMSRTDPARGTKPGRCVRLLA